MEDPLVAAIASVSTLSRRHVKRSDGVAYCTRIGVQHEDGIFICAFQFALESLSLLLSQSDQRLHLLGRIGGQETGFECSEALRLRNNVTESSGFGFHNFIRAGLMDRPRRAAPSRPLSMAVGGPAPSNAPARSPTGGGSANSNPLGGFGQSLAQEVDNATAKWMKMLSSTFLGDAASLTLGSALFPRKQAALTADRSRKDNEPTKEFKVALVGGAGVGKTSIVRRWFKRSYQPTYVPTIGVEVVTLATQFEREDVLVHLWDVSSMEVDANASALHSMICDDLDGVFFVFNVHRVSSIAAIDKWRHALSKYISAKEIPFFLLAHKADQLQKRVMRSDDIESYARAAGYRGWMWTVGRSSFGENEKHPAVMEALERMVEAIYKARQMAENARLARLARPKGIFTPSESSAPLQVLQTDDALHQFSASLLRIPTRAITTLPRDDNGLPTQDDEDKLLPDPTPSLERSSDQSQLQSANYGGNWILGNDKGVYLRVTDSSVVANDETDDEVEDSAAENYSFPFAATKHLEDTGADTQDEQDPDDTDNETLPDKSAEASKAALERQHDQEAWRFFAGSIDRSRAEDILAGREEGTFLLRRKDAQTLVLSYMGSGQVHHVLIEFAQQKYHIGSSKTSQVSFRTLWKCLRSVRKYAFRGLVFTRNVDFHVAVNKQELTLETDDEAEARAEAALDSTATASVWRTRTRSSSMSSGGTNSRHASPRKPKRVSGLQANQEQVQMPQMARVHELSVGFYDQLLQRLTELSAQQPQSPGGKNVAPTISDELASLLSMAKTEQQELKTQPRTGDAEVQWRQLVKDMEAWNRIVMNLELSSLTVA